MPVRQDRDLGVRKNLKGIRSSKERQRLIESVTCETAVPFFTYVLSKSMTTRIYHNPRCTKSRQALQLLNEQGLEPEIVLYLEDPPTEDELTDLVEMLGISAQQLIRKKEKLFQELELKNAEHSESEWIAILAQHPRLIERPIVVHNGKAAIGRPTEQIEAIL